MVENFWKFIGGLTLFVLSMLYTGFIISKFWLWFILPVFSNLPVLTIGKSIGLAFFVSAFRAWNFNNNQIDFWLSIFIGSIIQTILLIVGWIVFLII